MSEKTEQPTAKKLRKARQDGNTWRSAEFSAVAVMLAALAATVITGPTIVARLGGFTLETIATATQPSVDVATIGPLLRSALRTLALTLAPILGAALAAAAFFSYIQVGAMFTLKPLLPDPTRLDPIKGAKNIVSKRKAVDLLKNVTKLSLMAAIAGLTFSDVLAQLVRTPRIGLPSAAGMLVDTALDLTLYLVLALVIFAVADVLWQRHVWTKDMMMSKDEVKREYKESEGDPMVKSQRQAMHRQMMSEAGMRRVKEADVVVVNPTHVAVALRYREEESRAPQVVSRGQGEVAKSIKKLARRHRVPIVRDVPLARSLVELELDEEIPSEFYEPVAVVLRYVYEISEGERR